VVLSIRDILVSAATIRSGFRTGQGGNLKSWGSRIRRRIVASLATLIAASASAATAVDVVPVDLAALINQAAANPGQFAVNVPHPLSLDTAGTWSRAGTVQVWSYAVQIRGAVSMSFHAPVLRLPPGAVLTVRSAATTTTYRAADAGRGDFWSRVQPGDTLEFTLEVPAAQREQVAMQLSSFQAGYLGLSPDVPNHPAISRVRAQAASCRG
jgi:lysyl endopeptidase